MMQRGIGKRERESLREDLEKEIESAQRKDFEFRL